MSDLKSRSMLVKTMSCVVWLVITGIDLLIKSDSYKKHKEQFWINKLKTTQPDEMNIKDQLYNSSAFLLYNYKQ